MADETYNVSITPRPRRQIRDITRYLAENASVNAAEKVRDGIFEAIRKLERMPDSHGRSRFIESDNPIFRRLNVWKYVIVFVVDENAKTVTIVDVSHSSQDPQKLIDRLSAP